MAWHQDQVVEKPAMARVVGTSAFCRYAALAYGERAITLQPHPEFTAGFLTDLVAARRSSLPASIAEGALATLDRPLASPAIADRIEPFLKRARR